MQKQAVNKTGRYRDRLQGLEEQTTNAENKPESLGEVRRRSGAVSIYA